MTGIRASLQASMDVKRDAQGIVDAITAVDIGKCSQSTTPSATAASAAS